jgi:hypothetical protein
MSRFSAPITTLTGLVIFGILAAGCVSSGAAAAGTGRPDASSATVAPARATMDLTISGGVGKGSYAFDPAAFPARCTHATDGSWRLLYSGGTPGVELDFLVGPRAGQPDGSSQVALEAEAGAGYFRFDPSNMRGGDPKGRSTATIAVAPGATTTTFTVHATTPDRSTGEDGAPIDVGLTVTCPN